MAELKPIPTSRFYIEFDGLTEKMVASVGEITFEGEISGQDKPFSASKYTMNYWQSTAGRQNNPNISIEVYLVKGDMDWYTWYKRCMPSSEGGSGYWGLYRKSGSLTAYNSSDKAVLQWNIKNAWPQSYSVSDLAADGNEFVKETYDIVCEDIERVNPASFF
ncbi:phage tail protein [Spirulina sp. 06S082]|uniref:phage tail protein n=1 Tax=Spirulina sp. 06S082 TaxID=3110248 RepID=UPI002B1F2243|nr:phage tail protein [Spirulina sp. 06S082]MEA5467390.1 phage tail protein [Spirulina sp. 06S082]